MTNLPTSGQSDSMDNTSVTRNEFRLDMNQLLQYLAEALGSQNSYTTQGIASNAVKLNGAPTAPTPTAGDSSTKIATTAFVSNAVTSGGYLPLAGGHLTGGVTADAKTMAAGSSGWPISTANFWNVGAIAIPVPTGIKAGQSGLLRVTSAAATWPATVLTNVPTETLNVPVIIPFYAESTSVVRLGDPVEVG